MLTRSRNLLILAGFVLGASVAATRVPAIARPYDSGLRPLATADSDCPYHRAHARALAADSSDRAAVLPEGSIFYPGRAAVFTP